MQKYTETLPNTTTEAVIHTLLTREPLPRPTHQLFAVYDEGEWEYVIEDNDEMYQKDKYPYFISHTDMINPYRGLAGASPEVLPELIIENLKHIENLFDGSYIEIHPGCYLRHKVTSIGYATEIFYHNRWIPLYQPIDKPNEEYYMGWCSAYFIGQLLPRC